MWDRTSGSVCRKSVSYETTQAGSIKMKTIVIALVVFFIPLLSWSAEPRGFESSFAGTHATFEDPSADPWMVRENIYLLKDPMLVTDKSGSRVGTLVSRMVVSDTIVMKSFKGLRLAIKWPMVVSAEGPSVRYKDVVLPGFSESMSPMNPTAQVAWASRRKYAHLMLGANISLPELNSKPWAQDSYIDARPFVTVMRPGIISVGVGLSGSVVYDPWLNFKTSFVATHNIGAFRYGIESAHTWASSSHLAGPSIGWRFGSSHYIATFLKQWGRPDNTPDWSANLVVQKTFGKDPISDTVEPEPIATEAEITTLSNESRDLIRQSMTASPLIVESTEAFESLAQARKAVPKIETPAAAVEEVRTAVVGIEAPVPKEPQEPIVLPPETIEADVKPEIPEEVLADAEKKADIIKEEEPKIVFRFKKSKLMPTPKTEQILNAVYSTLSMHTEVKKLMVMAYYYSPGMDALRLAERRAQEVVKYLVKSGIQKNRLIVQALYKNKPDTDPHVTHMYFQVVE